MKIALARRIPIWFVAAALLSLAVQCDTGGPTGGLDADGVAANNRGVAYMGRSRSSQRLRNGTRTTPTSRSTSPSPP